MNLIAQAFEAEEEYKGTLRAGTSDVATARVTVFYNRLDPKEIRAKIGDITWFNTPSRQPIPAEEVSRLDFCCEENELTLKLDVTNSMCFTSAETSVLEYVKSTKLSGAFRAKIGSPALSSAVYLFPLTGFTISHSFSTFSDIKGYFRGYFKSDANDEKHVEWRDESITVETKLGVASLYDSTGRRCFFSLITAIDCWRYAQSEDCGYKRSLFLGLLGLVDHSHPAATELFEDLIVGYDLSDHGNNLL